MSATVSRVQPAEKADDPRRTAAKHDTPRRSEKPYGASRIEPQDWRGEGVVGDIHTD